MMLGLTFHPCSKCTYSRSIQADTVMLSLFLAPNLGEKCPCKSCDLYTSIGLLGSKPTKSLPIYIPLIQAILTSNLLKVGKTVITPLIFVQSLQNTENL